LRFGPKEADSALGLGRSSRWAPTAEETDVLRPTWPAGGAAQLRQFLADPSAFAVNAHSIAKELGFADSFGLCSVIEIIDRPALILGNSDTGEDIPAITDVAWKPLLEPHLERIACAAKLVGAIVLVMESEMIPIGTAWHISQDMLVTNRHVALRFSEHQSQGGFAFLETVLDNRPLRGVLFSPGSVGNGSRAHGPRITAIEFIANDYDVAFLRVKPTLDRPLPETGIPLAVNLPKELKNSVVVTVGFPLYRPELISKEMLSVPTDKQNSYRRVLMKYFASNIGEKMMQPGKVTDFDLGGAGSKQLRHSCSTLAGNSGSVVLNPKTGVAVGLHYGGIVLTTNFAVPAPTVLEIATQRKLL
jgi:hypothetical protein